MRGRERLMRHEALMNRIAGEIILSESPGNVMRKWRTLFELSQSEVARLMGVSPPVLSDYENNRRRSPGTLFVKRFVKALIEADLARGGLHVKRYETLQRDLSEAVIDMMEFESPRTASEVADALDAVILAGEMWADTPLYGYTVIDSIKAIKMLDALDFLHLFGRNPMRAIIFTKVSRGRSPMVAARLYPIKPKMIVIHGPRSPDKVDELAVELAELESICFALSTLRSENEIVGRLRNLTREI